ncbi:reverse transcriptase domain-containing protein, partial [Tanacetum coccineum]
MRTRSSSNLIVESSTIPKRPQIWLEKEPPRSIHTWEDLVSKFVNYFFPPSKTMNLKNDITNFQQRFDETFSKAWDRFKDLLHKCPQHSFSELHQIDTFYNALTQSDQNSLNAAADGNLLNRTPRDALTIIENKSKVRTSRNKPVVSNVSANTSSSTPAYLLEITALTDAIKAMLIQNKTPSPAHVKAMEEIYVTCGGPHPYYECLATDGNTFNASAATGTYNQGEQSEQTNDANMRAMKNQISTIKTELKNEIQSMLMNQNNELKNMMSSFVQMHNPSGFGSLPSNTIANSRGDLKVITTRSGVSYDGPTIPPTYSPLPKEVEREPEATKDKFLQIFQRLHFDISFVDSLLHMPMVVSTFKSLLSNKKKLFELANTSLNENCSAVLLKKFPEKLGDPVKFLIPCDFLKLEECLALADLGASINLIPLIVWKKLSLPKLTLTRMTLELANQLVAYPVGVAEDVFVKVGKFYLPADFVVVDYDVNPRVPLILGRPFLRTARALIDVYSEELTLRVNDEAITFNFIHTLRYSYRYDDESVNRIDVIDVTCEEYAQEVLGFLIVLRVAILLRLQILSLLPLPPLSLLLREV